MNLLLMWRENLLAKESLTEEEQAALDQINQKIEELGL